MDPLLDYDTALRFLEKIGVEDAEKLRAEDSIYFLKTLIRKFQEHIPFQCVSILAQPEVEKHVPTMEEIIEASLSLEGGVCFTLNTFMCILLRTLNFKADVVDGSYSTFGDTHTHVVVLLSDLRHPDDNYIIDVGGGFPFEAPLPVSELPCHRYYAGLEYRYERSNGDTIRRVHRRGDDISEGENPVMHGEWRQVFHFDLTPVTFDHFRPYMQGIYINDGACDFHTTLRAIRFPPSPSLSSSDLAGNNEPIMVAFKNRSLLVGPMDDARKTKVNAMEWAEKVKENFPTIPPHKVDLAVETLMGLEEMHDRKQ